MGTKKHITIVCTARMGHGTFEAKFNPLTRLDIVKDIFVIRKDVGPKLPKLTYRVLHKWCKNPIVNIISTPFVLFNEVKRRKADLILAYHYQPHFYFAYIVSKMTKIPYVIGQTGTDAQDFSNRKIMGFFLRHIVRNALSFNVPGKSTYDFWLKKKVTQTRLKILHSTIDIHRFKPTTNVTKYDFIFVGRLTEVKRLDKLILATKKLVVEYPMIKICIVGSGHLEIPLRKMVVDNGLNDFFDFVGLQHNIEEWLIKSKAFVMTSDSEGLPCAMMEAMSCELICLGPNVNNMSDLLIENKTGYMFKTSDINQLAEKMNFIMCNIGELKHIGAEARKLICNEHSYISAQEKWKEIFVKLIEE